MNNLDIILPALLLLIGFLFKMVIGRKWNIPDAVQSVCEFPVDVIFLALSFCVGYTISHIENQSMGLLYCFVGIVMATVIVQLWRITLNLYENKSKHKYKLWVLALVINLSIAFFGIFKSVDLIVQDEEQTNNTETQNQAYNIGFLKNEKVL
jgi:hypothetical protein